ncbi:IS3 family transposase [Pusillimonas sp.]|uniref:IS3 family transposase n=1 Tax=Pusillimonas sp. TaxID=3040095 RepID=UPI0039C8DF73
MTCYISYYNHDRIKPKLKELSPARYRIRSLIIKPNITVQSCWISPHEGWGCSWSYGLSLCSHTVQSDLVCG